MIRSYYASKHLLINHGLINPNKSVLSFRSNLYLSNQFYNYSIFIHNWHSTFYVTQTEFCSGNQPSSENVVCGFWICGSLSIFFYYPRAAQLMMELGAAEQGSGGPADVELRWIHLEFGSVRVRIVGARFPLLTRRLCFRTG